LRLREQNRIGDEVLISMLREADLASRAAEGNALPALDHRIPEYISLSGIHLASQI
jgi:hypothetical protein